MSKSLSAYNRSEPAEKREKIIAYDFCESTMCDLRKEYARHVRGQKKIREGIISKKKTIVTTGDKIDCVYNHRTLNVVNCCFSPNETTSCEKMARASEHND